MNRIRLRLFALTALLVSLASACVKAPPQSAAKLQGVDAAHADRLRSTVEEISRRQSQLDYLSAFVQVSVERGKQRRLFDAVLQVAPPDRLSILVLNDLGQEIARVVADGNTVFFHDNESGKSQRFAQDDQALRKTLKLPLTIEDLTGRLLLQLPTSPVLQVEREISPDKLQSYWVIRQDDALRLDPSETHLTRYEAKPGKSWRYRVDYSEYESVDGREFPHRIVWSFRRPTLSLALKLQQIAFRPPASRDIESSFDTQNR